MGAVIAYKFSVLPVVSNLNGRVGIVQCRVAKTLDVGLRLTGCPVFSR